MFRGGGDERKERRGSVNCFFFSSQTIKSDLVTAYVLALLKSSVHALLVRGRRAPGRPGAAAGASGAASGAATRPEDGQGQAAAGQRRPPAARQPRPGGAGGPGQGAGGEDHSNEDMCVRFGPLLKSLIGESKCR